MSVGKEKVTRLSIAISSGTGTGTLTPEWALARWLRIVPIAETDSFDLTIKDGSGFIMVKRTGQVGTWSENLQMSMGIMKTVLIQNATQDGTFTFLADLH